MTRILASLLLAISVTTTATAGDWIFRPSTFSHDPATGERVTQFAPIEPVLVPPRADYLRSGRRQLRSTIRAGNSLDVYNVVDQYGDDIRPYGEWLYPYRPYAVPYDGWGPPFGGVNGEIQRDESFRGGPRGRFDGGRYYDRGYNDRGIRDGGYRDGYDRRRDPVDARSEVRERFNGLYDSRDIPGDDEHYRDIPSRLDRMDDREFFSRPRG